MKKIILFLVVLTNYNSFSQKADVDIANSISSFNENQFANTISSENEKKWWQKLLNACTVVAADCAGAYAGVQGTIGLAGAVGLATGGTGVAVVAGIAGVIGGAGASNGAYQGLQRMARPNQIYYGNLNIIIPNNFIYYSTIGTQHNEVLYNNYFNGESIVNFYQPLLDKEQVRIIESQEAKDMFNYLQELGSKYAKTNYNFDYLINELIGKKLMTLAGKNILYSFFGKYRTCSSPKDMESLINYAIELVANSTLDDKEKHSLIAAIIVSSQSPFFSNPRYVTL